MTSVSPIADGGADALPSIINGGGAETFTNSPPAATGAYKNCGYKMSDIPPPSVSAVPDKAEYKQPEFKQPPVISEEGARQALIKHCESQFCWGKGTANELKFSSVESSTSYNYTLHTFTESRATQWQTEPYKGQPIDGPENGIPLDPWSIPMNVCENFRPIEVRKVEVPHTASIQACHICQGTGTMKCTGCDGNGGKLCNLCRGQGRRRQRTKGTSGNVSMVMSDCDGCNGTGKAPCVQCSGSGQMVCGTCHGTTRVKMFILLTVTWKTYTDSHIVGKANVPKALISKVKGTPVFEDIHPMLMPITVSPEPEIVAASARLIASHKYPILRILMQKHTITTIPITQCECSQKGGKKMTYYVYGLDNKVHAPTYPDTCCWGCEIM